MTLQSNCDPENAPGMNQSAYINTGQKSENARFDDENIQEL